MNKPLLIAHRGDTINFPENTFESFESAFEKGADGVEMDAQLNKDGDVIIVHDFMFDQNKKYPLLRDVVEKCKDKGRLEIELKSLEPQIVDKVANIIFAYRVKNYEITSSVLPLLPHVKKALPDAKIGMIFRKNMIEPWMSEKFITTFIEGYMMLTGANVLHYEFDLYTKELVESLHEKGYLAHTLLRRENTDKYNYIQEMGLDQCTFDDINLLEAVKA